MRDPNEFVDGVPLTPQDILARMADRLDEVAALERKRDAAKGEAKKHGEEIDAKMEEVADLASLWKKGRPCFALVDGTVTAEAPRTMPLWEAAGLSQARAAEQAKADPITSPIYLRFGEGKCDALAFARVLYPEKCGRAHVQNEGPGAWSAYHNGELVSKGWRSAADAMLAVFAHAKAEGFEEAGWEAVAKIGPVEPEVGVTGADGSVRYGADAPAAPAPKARKRKDPEAKTWPAQADDGTTYRAVFQGQTIAVAQVGAPGPWHGYAAGERKVSDLEHSEAAKLALAEALGAKPKDLAWMSKMDNPTTEEAPKPARRARRTAAAAE